MTNAEEKTNPGLMNGEFRALTIEVVRWFCHHYRMCRVLLTNLLLVAIVACPLNCWGMFERGLVSSEKSTPKCKCCAHDCDSERGKPSGQHRDRTSDQGDEDCRCPCCVCNGAVAAPKIVLSDSDLSEFSVALLMPHLFAQSELGNVPATGYLSRRISHRSTTSGRAARILFRSFLI